MKLIVREQVTEDMVDGNTILDQSFDDLPSPEKAQILLNSLVAQAVTLSSNPEGLLHSLADMLEMLNTLDALSDRNISKTRLSMVKEFGEFNKIIELPDQPTET